MENGEARSAWQELHMLMDLTAPWALRVVATLRVPDLIASGVTRLAEIAERCSADAGMLGRVLRYLVTRGVFEEPDPGSFALTPMGRLLEDRAGTRAYLDQDGFGGRMDRAWTGLLDAVRTGQSSYPRIFGRPFWEDLEANSRIGESYNHIMEAQSESFGPELAASYDWNGVREVIDVGGGTGTVIASLARAFPHLRATVLDLPETAQGAAERFAREGLAGRCRAQAGSMFDPLPQGADVYLLSLVIGDWDDAQAVAVLRHCAEAAEAAGPRGRVLILEVALEHGPVSSSAVDLLMLVLTGGRLRTLEQLCAVVHTAGLEVARVNSMPHGHCLIECTVP